ncbi:helix-turn-helix domain-containing protein [Paenibacillus allorhizosphaerae]|uniref:HTH-type transcriptional regulator YesS n=1 Tax=Paenibacillus allorhizosphaerae TaxID=2849866 RepID=A0ABM8VDI4_9BACL|nr:helix-turn-helix domain-containing protein [Paenibacillus allorhizosphaerae]CAG7627896.1 HTH-type transcriptional regulator YesS [Paenibacillus allorhizosphaerae]
MFGTFRLLRSLWKPGAHKGKGIFYKKSLVLILLITSIPGLITGVLMYWFAGGRVEDELVQLHKNQIAKRAETMGGQFAHLELTMSHLSYEPLFDYRLLETDFFRRFDVARDITKTLMVLEGSMALKTKLELDITGGAMPVRFFPQFDTFPANSAELRQVQSLLKQGAPIYWTQLPSKSEGEPSDLVLVQKMPGGTLEPYGILSARLSPADLRNVLKTLTPYDEGEALLLHEDGTILASTALTGSAEESSAQRLSLRTEVMRHKGDVSSFLWKWKDNKYSVTFGQLERIGSNWLYVSAAPIDAITRPVVFLSKLVMQVSGAGLLLALMLAWFASRRIYSPMARLLNRFGYGKLPQAVRSHDEFQLIEEQWLQLTRQSMAMQSKLESQLPQVRQVFLLQLIQGYLSSYTEEELRERMRQHGWKAEQCRYTVLFIRLGMTQASRTGRYSLDDEGLVSFAAANIAHEMAEERFGECQVINFHDLTVGIVLELEPQECGDDRSGIHAWAQNLILTLNRILKLQATVSIGGGCENIRDIPVAFNQARLALNYRKWDADNQIIDAELVGEPQKKQGIAYPFDSERELIQAMRTGQPEEAERQVHAFLESLAQEGATDLDVRQGVMNLLCVLEREMLHSGLNPNELLSPADRYGQLSGLRESEQILRWFMARVIRPFMEEMEHRSDDKLRKMVELAMQYMDAHYMRDLSLDECAEVCGANVFVLSRSFKRVTGQNFIDYLTDLRIGKAKTLLRDTEHKINDIAERVGYQHSYFNRLFKKFEGVTPTQYRERVRNV